MRTHLRLCVVGIACAVGCVSESLLALDTVESNAEAVDLSQSDAVLYAHDSILFGLSCRSGAVAKLQGVSVVRLGDTISAGGRSFRVGVIVATKYNEDAKWGGEVLARKGDVICVIAADPKSLPYNDDCKALWVRAPACRAFK